MTLLDEEPPPINFTPPPLDVADRPEEIDMEEIAAEVEAAAQAASEAAASAEGTDSETVEVAQPEQELSLIHI